jgi:LIVCS family branched-chain amino acid:cation transporter
MTRLSRRDQLVIGLTLFSMFFGAGNLIFPPTLGAQAGTAAPAAFLGFALSAIGLPVLGVAAVARTGGLPVLAGRVGRRFSAVFVLLIYLSIGPCLAIPRTASTSFEMAVTPFAGASPWLWLLRTGYSAVFFGAALAMALRPNRLREWLGKRLAPLLLLLIAVLFFGSLFSGLGGAAAPLPAYTAAPAFKGFLDGYQTMDAMAALIFGIVLAMNIRSCGVSETNAVVGATIRAGWLAGGLFALVYGALTWLGTLTGASCGVPADANGAALLTALASRLFGRGGQIILAAIFVIACLNTCTGLVCCCAEYFSGLFPRLSYRAWAVAFAVVSAVIANAGLDAILKFSIPVLLFLYPLAIVLIFLAFLPAAFADRTHLYPVCAGFTAAASLIEVLAGQGVPLPAFLTAFCAALPLAGQGLGWVSAAVSGALIGLLWPRAQAEKT